jgi:hypothetical protein
MINLEVINVHSKVSCLAMLVCGQGGLLSLAKGRGRPGKDGARSTSRKWPHGVRRNETQHPSNIHLHFSHFNFNLAGRSYFFTVLPESHPLPHLSTTASIQRPKSPLSLNSIGTHHELHHPNGCPLRAPQWGLRVATSKPNCSSSFHQWYDNSFTSPPLLPSTPPPPIDS